MASIPPSFFLREQVKGSKLFSTFEFASLDDLETAITKGLHDSYGIFNIEYEYETPYDEDDKYDACSHANGNVSKRENPLSITYTKSESKPAKVRKVEQAPRPVAPIRPTSFWDRLRGETSVSNDDEDEEDEGEEDEDQNEYAHEFDDVFIIILNDGVLLSIKDSKYENMVLKRALEKQLKSEN